MAPLTKAGADRKVLQTAAPYLRRWKGNARLYAQLAEAHWGLSQWRESIRYGRMALALDSRQVQTVKFLLAAYRHDDRASGTRFGEAWLARHGVDADVCRHLSIVYDDLGHRSQALAVARRGFAHAPTHRRLAGCIAIYLAKLEGAASALQFAGEHRELFAGDTYCENALANGLVTIGAYADAEKILVGLHRRHPRDVATLVSLLEAWFRCGRHRETLEAVEIWQRDQPVTAALANEAGRASVELDRPGEAIAWFERAIALAPDSATYADNHAIALGRVGRQAESIAAARHRLAAPGSPDRRRLLKSIAVNHTFLGQHTEALACYEQAFAEFPDDDEALINVIVGFTWLKRYEDAAAFAQKFRAGRSATLAARFWSELAWSLHNCDRFADEEAAVQEWARRYPHDVDVVRAMKRALNRLDRGDEALAFTRAWVDANPHVAAGWRYLAEQHAACGNTEAELDAITEACHRAPDDADLVDTRLGILRRLHRSQEALDFGRTWLDTRPGLASASLFNRIGLAGDDLEQWIVAEDHYRRAHEKEPANGIWAGNFLRALILQDRTEDAIAHGRRWLAAHPWDNYLAAKLAWALRHAGQLDQEAAVLRQAAQADETDTEVQFLLLSSLVAQKRTEEAQAWLEHCVAAGTATGRLWNDWANHLRELERHVEAEAAYREALRIAPDNDVAAGNLAVLLVHLGRGAAAVQLCRDWLQRRPDDQYVRRQLAHACYTIDDFATAEPEYHRLLAQEPDSLFLCERAVACLRLMGRHEDALAEAARWLSRHPGTAFLFIEMGIAAHRLQRLDEAVTHYDAALHLEPASSAAALRKMGVLAEQHRLDRALDFGETWSTSHPGAAHGDFHNELGILQDRAGRTPAAEQSFLQATNLDPHNATFAGNAVEILARQDRLTESIQLGQRHIAQSPPNAYLLRRLAESHGAHHDFGPALDLLTSADILEPTDPDVARVFLRLAVEGDELERGIAFGQAWLARPDNTHRAGLWAHLARLHFRADHDDEAFATLEKAIDLEPGEIAHIQTRFAFWTALGSSRTVIAEFPALSREWQDDARLLKHVSRAYSALGLDAEALEHAARNLAANPASHEACAWLADLLDQGGRTDEARDCLRTWIALHGEQPAVLRIRARLALHENHCAAALADAERALGHNRADEESFILVVRALRRLDRGPEAQARLHYWLEHHDSSPAIERLLDEKADGAFE